MWCYCPHGLLYILIIELSCFFYNRGGDSSLSLQDLRYSKIYIPLNWIKEYTDLDLPNTKESKESVVMLFDGKLYDLNGNEL